MASLANVVNGSRCEVEAASLRRCPRCGGSGATSSDADRGRDCDICGGSGRAWVACSGSGWTRAYGEGAGISRLW